jgi:hypothetical protein
MKNVTKYMFVAILMIAAAGLITAGDIVFQDGGMEVSDDLTVSGMINQTNTGVVRVFDNGCQEISNSTGWYLEC